MNIRIGEEELGGKRAELTSSSLPGKYLNHWVTEPSSLQLHGSLLLLSCLWFNFRRVDLLPACCNLVGLVVPSEMGDVDLSPVKTRSPQVLSCTQQCDPACSHAAGVQKAGFSSTLTLFPWCLLAAVPTLERHLGMRAKHSLETGTKVWREGKIHSQAHALWPVSLLSLLVFVDHFPTLQILVLAL